MSRFSRGILVSPRFSYVTKVPTWCVSDGEGSEGMYLIYSSVLTRIKRQCDFPLVTTSGLVDDDEDILPITSSRIR